MDGDGQRWSVLALAVIGTVYAGSELAGRSLPLPSARRSVPQWWWRAWNGEVAAAASGFSLGTGVTTVMRYPGFFLLAAWCAIRHDWVLALCVFGSYGLARSVPIVAAAIPVLSGLSVIKFTDLAVGQDRLAHATTALFTLALCALLVASGLR